MPASIVKTDLIKGLGVQVDKDGRHATRSVIVQGLTGTNDTTYFTTAFNTVGTNIGDPWPNSPTPPTNGLNVYCSHIEYKPINGDKCEMVYTYNSYPFDLQLEISSCEMQEETIFDGGGNMITTVLNGKTIPMKITRVYSNIVRILRWSEFNSYANIASYFTYRDCTDASRCWRVREVNAQNADNNYINGLWLMAARVEGKTDQWKTATWLEDSKGYPIQSTVTVAYPYPAVSLPTGWI